jgi:hypothetical protein
MFMGEDGEITNKYFWMKLTKAHILGVGGDGFRAMTIS